MKKKIVSLIMLMSLTLAGCAESAPAEVLAEPEIPEETAAEEPEEAPEPEYPLLNEDGSYTYQFEFENDYLSADFAGTDVFDTTEDYPRERFEDVFMYSKGAYLNDPNVDPEIFNEWGYSCPAADCKPKAEDPNFGFYCHYLKNVDGKTSFIVQDINYTMAVRWEKGQTLYHLWDNEITKLKYERAGQNYNNGATKEILAGNGLVGTDAKAFVDSFEEGLYDKVVSTLSDNNTAYSPLFRFDNGVMRAKNVDGEALGDGSYDGIGFEFMFPDLGRKVYEVIVDRETGRVFCTLFRTPYPGENFYAYPAGVEWNESGPVTPDITVPEFEDAEADEPVKEDKPAEEEKTEEEPKKEEPAASTGVVIDEAEFAHGVMMSAKQGTIVNDDFATSVRNSFTAQVEGMGATASSDPSSLIFRRNPFRFGTSAEEAATAIINDVLPMYGFDMTGKNYYLGAVEKFDNGYVVTVGWTRW